jgi:hypothetical protein
MQIDSFENFRYFSFSIQFLLINVEQLFVVIDQIPTNVRFAGGSSEVWGLKSVHCQQSGAPDCRQVVVGHQVLGALVGNRVQVTDESSKRLIVEAGKLAKEIPISENNNK